MGGIEGLEVKQIQEERDKERKKKELAHAEIQRLKTQLSELGFVKNIISCLPSEFLFVNTPVLVC